VSDPLPSAPAWQARVLPFVRWRHPLLLALVLFQSWTSRESTDWDLLTGGAHALFGPHPLSLYATHEYLQAGPPGLVAVRAFDGLPGSIGVAVAHILLAILGWYLLFLTERWCVPGARFFSVPFMAGLRTLLVGIPVMLIWTFLAGGAPHVEDGLAFLTFVLAVRAVAGGREIRAAILVGLTAAWKPWGVVALPLLLGLPRKWRAILIAVAIPAACWLPFLLSDPETLKQVSHGFVLQSNSTLRALGMSGSHVPSWWRGAELVGALAAAGLAAVRRSWMVAFAAGCTARLLLDPAGFDYYVSGLVLATALTERLANLKPWRTALLAFTFIYTQVLFSSSTLVPMRFAALAIGLVSWLHPWRVPEWLRSRWLGSRWTHQSAVPAGLLPMPRTAPSDVTQDAVSH
jgi:hypothetical protein